MACDLRARRVLVYYGEEPETHWLLFEAGHMSEPLRLLTDFEMKRLVGEYEEQSALAGTVTHGESGKT
jgi:hypothetical protein